MPTRIIVTAVVGPEILNAGDNIYVAQGGFIGSEDYHAIIPLAHNHSIIIDGTVLGHESAIASNWNSTGIRIALGETGIVSGAADPAMFLSGGNHSIVNFGQIRGALDGISMDTSMGTQSTIENHGTIQANNAAIDRANASSTEKLVIKNFGTISGGSFSFHHVDSNAIEHITNKGLMIGDVSLGLGNDLYDGRKGTIDGAIRGGGGNDKLYAGAGDDAIHGEAGNDILIGGAGRDVLNGGTGTDRASYNSANAGVTVNLSKPSLNTGDAKGDTYSSIEELAGSYFNDNLTGNSLNNWILGSDGTIRLMAALAKTS
jgi:Ca2+-binding RTX toxin-like protein